MQTVSAEFLAAVKDATIIAPELPESTAFETLETLEELEASIVKGSVRSGSKISSKDYAEGSATQPNEVRVYGTDIAKVLVSADHATSPFSRRQQKCRGADHGTGALALLLSKRVNSQSLIPIGKQTWNVAVANDAHPLKLEIGKRLPGKDAFMSLHGMRSGKLRDLADPSEIHAIIGLGNRFNHESRTVADKIVDTADDLGLRVVVGNNGSHYEVDTLLGTLKEKDGEYYRGELMAHRDEMTTNYAYRVMDYTGHQVPSLQLEMTRLLRLIPHDVENGWHKDRKARAIGVHLGYLLVKATVELLADDTKQSITRI